MAHMTPEQTDDYARGYSEARIVVDEVGVAMARRWMRALIASADDATAPYLLGVSDLIADAGSAAHDDASGVD